MSIRLLNCLLSARLLNGLLGARLLRHGLSKNWLLLGSLVNNGLNLELDAALRSHHGLVLRSHLLRKKHLLGCVRLGLL